MALVKLIKVYASQQPTLSLGVLVEHRNLKEFLLVETNSAVELSKKIRTVTLQV